MTNNPSVSAQPEEKQDKDPPPQPSPSSFKCSPTNPVVSCSLKRKRPLKIEIPNLLQEIQANSLKVRDVTPRDEAVCFSGLGVGVFSVKGKKKFMEDTHKIVSCLHGNSNKAFFGVYDGHGGKKAAEFVAENLHNNIFEMLKNCEGNKEKEEAVKAGYLKTDEEFLKQDIVSGTCCVTALIEGKEIVVSNLGDCRAVLCKGGVAEALTTDHKAEQVDERKRIENKGGYIEFHRGAWRVHGILSVSRSIGDAHLKDWVLAEPETKIFQLTPDMEFLVLASDGLWQEVSGQEVVDIVTRLLVGKRLGASGGLSKENDEDYGCVNVSPSSKIRRVSLVKQQKEISQSPRCKKNIDDCKDNEDEFACEKGSPPSKLRRISLVKRISMKPESPSQENAGFKKRPSSAGLMAACKELVSLAVSRGSLDDITIMIIDLNHFKCNT
ncbi:probable protein phosphatase 2C 14 [Durio zibethinus]|uniref:protein-serine/threonine phosphatase n=1 Tax=Durio zibethinus TaxID=66656 RepID=A0A6P6BER5_DURZI|nr:probable protein phosphatase 2C 14 [Durio zibethinus]